jgi:large-conductance mechanosensitive channel
MYYKLTLMRHARNTNFFNFTLIQSLVKKLIIAMIVFTLSLSVNNVKAQNSLTTTPGGGCPLAVPYLAV